MNRDEFRQLQDFEDLRDRERERYQKELWSQRIWTLGIVLASATFLTILGGFLKAYLRAS
jgi:hypothetical protein